VRACVCTCVRVYVRAAGWRACGGAGVRGCVFTYVHVCAYVRMHICL